MIGRFEVTYDGRRVQGTLEDNLRWTSPEPDFELMLNASHSPGSSDPAFGWPAGNQFGRAVRGARDLGADPVVLVEPVYPPDPPGVAY